MTLATTALQECARLGLPRRKQWNSEQDIARAEEGLGASIPADYLAFLGEVGSLDGEGTPLSVRVPLVRNSGEVLRGFGMSLYDVLPMFLYEDRLGLLADTWRMAGLDVGASKPWCTQLVPISDLGFSFFWCFDLRYDPVNPPVIRLEYDGVPERPDPNPIRMRWIRYVAPSFTQLLRQAMYFQDWEQEASDAFSQMDENPYEYSAEVLDWQRSTETYLAQFGPVQSIFDAPQ